VTKTPSGRMLFPDSYSKTLPLPKEKKKKKKQLSISAGDSHVKITSTFSYQADVEMRETKKAQEAILTPKVRGEDGRTGHQSNCCHDNVVMYVLSCHICGFWVLKRLDVKE